jgi:hypothetical protein
MNTNYYMLITSSLWLCICTGTFILFAGQIFFKQIVNFCVNRTTAERFSRTSKAKTKKVVANPDNEEALVENIVKEGEG